MSQSGYIIIVHWSSAHLSFVFFSAWLTSVSLRASTVPNTLQTWCLQRPNLTQCKQSLCLTLSILAWSNLRYLVLKTSIMLCWNAPRKSRERVSSKASYNRAHVLSLMSLDCPEKESVFICSLLIKNNTKYSFGCRSIKVWRLKIHIHLGCLIKRWCSVHWSIPWHVFLFMSLEIVPFFYDISWKVYFSNIVSIKLN